MGRWGLHVFAAGVAVAAASAACGRPSVSELNPGNPTPIETGSPPPSAPQAPGRYHPEGFSDPTQHGPQALRHDDQCENCHGQNLDGGSVGISCDTCHTSGWRKNCTFCHGGTADQTGAPPREISGSSDLARSTFKAHTAHVNASPDHVAFDCVQCHVKPVDAMDPGHWYDTTPGKAEVDFTGGLSDTGVYGGNGQCESYCHSKAQGVNGFSTDADPKPACNSCHAYEVGGMVANTSGLATMSGFHTRHMVTAVGGPVKCSECHGATVDATGKIIDATRHVNGVKEIKFTTSTMTMTNLGCDGTCHGQAHFSTTYKWNGTGVYHPTGFADKAIHGLQFKEQTQDCRVCHGADLKGGSIGVSCDTCHMTGWRTNCTYCHGGTNTTTGAPPRDINGNTNPATISFRAHTKHTTLSNHPAYDCVQCHKKPADVLTPGHNFDATKGMAEVTFLGGLSTMGTYAGGGSCAGLYCHGDGKGATGAYTDAQPTPTCSGCHPYLDTPSKWVNMSGFHASHLQSSTTIVCSDCHNATVNASGTVVGPALHVNGAKDVKFSAATLSMSGTVCTGTCHNFTHGYDWYGSGQYHPAGWSASAVHGLAAKTQTQNCRTCHGADLLGGTSKVGCDGCHQPGWRTNCTYCHGGTSNSTGAPPRDINNTTTNITFAPHTRHVTLGTDHAAFDCIQCHSKPTDVLTPNHMFDSTPGKAEVNFALSLSVATAYDGTTCSANYCHGNGTGSVGSIAKTATGPLGCGSCHLASPITGQHDKHNNYACSECHGTTMSTNSSTVIGNVNLHVNGKKDTAFLTSNIVMNPTTKTCTGTCHAKPHSNFSW